MGGVAGDLSVDGGVSGGLRRIGRLRRQNSRWEPYGRQTLLRRRFEAMMAISSQIRLLVSKSRVSFG